MLFQGLGLFDEQEREMVLTPMELIYNLAVLLTTRFWKRKYIRNHIIGYQKHINHEWLAVQVWLIPEQQLEYRAKQEIKGSSTPNWWEMIQEGEKIVIWKIWQ